MKCMAHCVITPFQPNSSKPPKIGWPLCHVQQSLVACGAPPFHISHKGELGAFFEVERTFFLKPSYLELICLLQSEELNPRPTTLTSASSSGCSTGVDVCTWASRCRRWLGYWSISVFYGCMWFSPNQAWVSAHCHDSSISKICDWYSSNLSAIESSWGWASLVSINISRSSWQFFLEETIWYGSTN